MTKSRYNEIYTAFENKLKSLSYSEHVWDMGRDETYLFAVTDDKLIGLIAKTFIKDGKLRYALYDRGNETILVGFKNAEVYWNKLDDNEKAIVLQAFDNSNVEPITLEQAKADIKRELGFLSDYADEIVENIAEEVMQDILECADTDYNDSDIRLAIGRVLAKATAKK